ncbi:MAG: RluA family pseudouridine synthase [Candidatus Omnitrophica bacterium]|nr:RluA family pseudouridine synthase [Candidatus Omnitrophota bacterium]
MNIPVVFEDDWILVADKPSGLLTIPSPKNEPRTLTSILNDDAKEKGFEYRLHPCHRLDRDTSGLIIYAKGKSIQKKMMDEFRRHHVRKSYIAFVRGALNKNRGEIDIPIERQSARTRYQVLERRRGYDIVEVHPLTGRTNQIRIHLRTIGYPILGESRYAFRRDFNIKAKRLCLHAGYIEFRHPHTGRIMKLSAGLPQELKKFLARHA